MFSHLWEKSYLNFLKQNEPAYEMVLFFLFNFVNDLRWNVCLNQGVFFHIA